MNIIEAYTLAKETGAHIRVPEWRPGVYVRWFYAQQYMSLVDAESRTPVGSVPFRASVYDVMSDWVECEQRHHTFDEAITAMVRDRKAIRRAGWPHHELAMPKSTVGKLMTFRMDDMEAADWIIEDTPCVVGPGHSDNWTKT